MTDEVLTSDESRSRARRRSYAFRLFWVFVGVGLIGLGSGLLRAIDVGVDPYTAANIGISRLLGMELGTYQLLSNAVLFVIGIGVFALGASLYMTAALGTAPYDALAPMIVDGTNAKYRLVRVLQDVLFLVLAIVFHGAIGVGTVVTAFFTGPLIEFWTRRVSTPLMARSLEARSLRQSRTRTARTHV